MIYRKYHYDLCTISRYAGHCQIKLLRLSSTNGAIASFRVATKNKSVVHWTGRIPAEVCESARFTKEEACRFVHETIKCPKDKLFILC